MLNNSYLYGFVLLFLITGCAIKKPKVSESKEAVKAVPRAERKRLISSLEENKIEYTSFNGKAKTKLTINDKSFNATLTLRIKPKEIIWISVTAFLGIEVARVLITPERIKIINRLQSEYTDKPFEEVYQYTSSELGFDEIENLLTGNTLKFAFDPGLDFFTTSTGYETEGKHLDLTYFMKFTDNHKLEQANLTQSAVDQSLVSKYSDFQAINGQELPKTTQLSVKAPKVVLDALLNFTNITLNEELQFPFNIPDGYKQSD